MQYVYGLIPHDERFYYVFQTYVNLFRNGRKGKTRYSQARRWHKSVTSAPERLRQNYKFASLSSLMTHKTHHLHHMAWSAVVLV